MNRTIDGKLDNEKCDEVEKADSPENRDGLELVDEDFAVKVEGVLESSRGVSFDFLEEDELFLKLGCREVVKNTGDIFLRMAENLDLEKSAFWNHEGIKADFRERLEIFSIYLNDQLVSIRPAIEQAKVLNKGKFVENWEDLLRRVAYYAFFLHYGAKRRGELDGDGNLRDYVYHVVRSSLNCLVRKLRFMDIQSLLVGILHDTREDFNEGIIGLWNADEEELDLFLEQGKSVGGINKILSKEKKQKMSFQDGKVLEELAVFERFLDGELLKGNYEQVLSVGESVDMLTKKGGGRMRETVKLLNNLVGVKDIKKILAIISVLLVKFGGDRLDNMKSTVSEKVRTETLMIFYLFFQKLGLKLLLNQMKDYFFFDDVRLRESITDKWLDSYVVDKDEVALPKAFMKDFVDKFKEKMGEGDLRCGVDFSIDLVPIGHRHAVGNKTGSAVSKLFSNHRDFRHYILFIPLSSDNNLNARMKDSATAVFRDMFPEDENLTSKAKFQNVFTDVFGNLIKSKRGGSGFDSYNKSDSYGVSVWSVYDSPEDFIDSFGGDFYMAYFERDFQAKSNINTVVKSYSDDISRLEVMYSFLDAAKNGATVAEILASTKYQILRVLDDSCPLDLTEDDLIKMGDKILPLLTISLFGRREKKVRVFLGNSDLGEVSVPFNVTNLYEENTHILSWAAPNLMGIKDLKFVRDKKDDRCIRIVVPEKVVFSERSWNARFKIIKDFVESEKERIITGIGI